MKERRRKKQKPTITLSSCLFSVHRFTNAREDAGFFGSHGGSGGYLEETFKYAAKALYGKDVTELKYKPGRNPDFQEVTLEVSMRYIRNTLCCSQFVCRTG